MTLATPALKARPATHLCPTTGTQPRSIPSDLRRLRKAEDVEFLLQRAEFLPAQDRALLRSTLRAGQSAAQIATIRGENPRAVRREIRAVIQRVLAPEFPHVIARRDRWRGPRRNIAQACFVEGRSIRATAASLGLSVHIVRRYCESIRVGARDATEPPTPITLPPQRTGQ